VSCRFGLWTESVLCRDQFWNADQVVGDEVDQEAAGYTGNAAMLGFAHCAMLFTPAEDAFDHFAPFQRHRVALMSCGPAVDGAATALAGFGDCVVSCHMRRNPVRAQIGDVIGGIIGLVLGSGDALA